MRSKDPLTPLDIAAVKRGKRIGLELVYSKKKDIIKFKGAFAKFVNKNDNSIKSLLVLLRKKNLISSYYSITVEKMTPVYAGLGGGTSNAFFVMKHLLKNKLNKKELNDIEKKIGTDLKLFFAPHCKTDQNQM